MDQIRGKVLDELWILTFFEVTFNNIPSIGRFIDKIYSPETFSRSNGTQRKFRCCAIGCRRDSITIYISINVPVSPTS